MRLNSDTWSLGVTDGNNVLFCVVDGEGDGDNGDDDVHKLGAW